MARNQLLRGAIARLGLAVALVLVLADFLSTPASRVGLPDAQAAPPTNTTTVESDADVSGRWACAGTAERRAHPAELYLLRSVGPEIRPDWVPIWGNDPAGRGPTRISRLDPVFGTTLAEDDEAGIGFSSQAGSDRIARMTYAAVGGEYPQPLVTGVEFLHDATLQREAVLPIGTDLYFVSIAHPGGNRILTVEMTDPPLAIDAVCRDPAKPAAPVSRVRLHDPVPGVLGCGIGPRVRLVDDGSAFVLVPLCRVYPEQGSLRLYRIDPTGEATHVDLPWFPYDPPLAFSPDGSRLFIADHQRQELFSIATGTGQVLWQMGYGTVPPESRKLKYVGSPTQIELAPDGRRMYLISNWAPEPSPGVWVIDARTGTVLDHLLVTVGVTGIAVDPSGNLFVVSPEAGGRLWVLPDGDPQRLRLLRDDLGDQVSGVSVGS